MVTDQLPRQAWPCSSKPGTTFPQIRLWLKHRASLGLMSSFGMMEKLNWVSHREVAGPQNLAF